MMVLRAEGNIRRFKVFTEMRKKLRGQGEGKENGAQRRFE